MFLVQNEENYLNSFLLLLLLLRPVSKSNHLPVSVWVNINLTSEDELANCLFASSKKKDKSIFLSPRNNYTIQLRLCS